MKSLSLKTGIVFFVILAAVIYLLPTFKEGIWPYKKINLGLDLQGGMHLVLEVDSDKSVESTIERMIPEIRSELKSERIRIAAITPENKTRIAIKVQEGDDTQKLEDFFKSNYKNMKFSNPKRENGYVYFYMELSHEESKHIKDMAVRQALETIRNRIDQFGVSEPDIRLQGEKRILIQLPGIKDTDRAKELIGKTALLEFKLLDEIHSTESALQGNIPPGSELLYQVEKKDAKIPYLIKQRALLTGAYLTDARVQIDSQFNEPYVSIDFDKRGGKLFEKITEENVKKRLAIVLDGKVYSAPVIQEKISGGAARITGSFTIDEARDLAIVLRAGALPAPVKIIEERTVGPSLGSDSIRKGLLSMCAGGLLVILFMLIYYKGAGLIADIALILNLVLIAGGLAAFQATLTLPGIAGIILTIGMAVDANVIIFERIKEESDIGKPSIASLNAGFDRAMLPILDANVTTLIAALVLFQFGTGPVKGFAITLSLGVLSSLFTSLVLSRLIFGYIFLKTNVKKLSI